MTSDIAIHQVRLTFIWFQPILDHWREAIPLLPSMSFMADVDEFAKKLGSLHSSPDHDGRMLPWPFGKGHHIWEHYLERENYGEANANVLGKHLIPVREKPGFRVEANWFSGYLTPEVYYFPFGVAFLLNAVYTGEPISFEDAVNLAYNLRYDKKITLTLTSSMDCKLKDLAAQVLDSLVQRILGTGAVASISANQPFSLFTVVQGKYKDPQPVAEGGDIHRYLYALTEWSPSWKVDGLPALAKGGLHASKWPPSHLIYTQSRGHAIWFPQFFAQEYNEKHFISCYYRNQVMDTLLVESFARFLIETAKRLNAGKPIPTPELDCSKYAAELIGRLYHGGKDTFRTLRNRALIDQNDGWLENINKVSVDLHGKPELSPLPPGD